MGLDDRKGHTTPDYTVWWIAEGTGVFHPEDGVYSLWGGSRISRTAGTLSASCLIGAIIPGTGEDSACAPVLPKRMTHTHTTLAPMDRVYCLGFFLMTYLPT